MAKNKLVIPKKKDVMLYSTDIENLFISEFLPIAPGDYVKVYLFGLMNAQYEIPVERTKAGAVLGMSVDDIDSAWAYWESKGVVKREQDKESGGEKIIFLSQVDAIYGNGTCDEESSYEEKSAPSVAVHKEEKQGDDNQYDDNHYDNHYDDSRADYSNPDSPEYIDDMAAMLTEMEIRSLFSEFEEATGKPISSAEGNKIRESINVYDVTPDVFSYAIKYCTENEKYSIDYICRVALNWKEEGCNDISQVKELLDKNSEKRARYNMVFKEVGFTRKVTDGDAAIMDRWFEDWGYKMDEVLAACRKTAGLRDPNLNYVNKILENKMNEEGRVSNTANQANGSTGTGRVSKKVLSEYLEYLRNNAEIVYHEHIEEVKRIPKLAKILSVEKELQVSMATLDFGPTSREERRIKFKRMGEVQEEKIKALRENGYPDNYLDKVYKCSKCKDNGVTETGEYCTCVETRVAEAYKWNQKRRKANRK